ncbi:MAG: hypothetical protein JWM34_4798 [Ilumatobacteraceae bacterium]|nr:hypothetical protein [Ilumatobacteraceae bacterium]
MAMSGGSAIGVESRTRGRGTFLIALSFIGFFASSVALPYGIVSIVLQSRNLRQEAVARGSVGYPDDAPVARAFSAVKGQTYTIYVDVDSDAKDEPERVAGDTNCDVRFADGSGVRVAGGDQSEAGQIGHLASVGDFSGPPGPATVSCTEATSRRPYDALPFYVGRATHIAIDVLLIIGGAAVLTGAVFAAIFGYRRRRRPIVA